MKFSDHHKYTIVYNAPAKCEHTNIKYMFLHLATGVFSPVKTCMWWTVASLCGCAETDSSHQPGQDLPPLHSSWRSRPQGT